jgi:HEAT repeat protein
LAGDSKAVSIAEKAMDDQAPEVREAAATSLGLLHSVSSIPKLKLALNDKDPIVVLAAAHSLCALGDKEGYEVYYEILLGERKAAPGLVAGQEAMFRDHKKLAEFAFEQGIEFNPFAGIGWGIIKTVHQDDVSPVRAAAAAVLADDADPHSGRALAKSCSDKNWMVRVAALEALARRGDPAFLEDVEPHTADENDRVRFTAAAAIVRLSGAPSPAIALTDKPAPSEKACAPAVVPPLQGRESNATAPQGIAP